MDQLNYLYLSLPPHCQAWIILNELPIDPSERKFQKDKFLSVKTDKLAQIILTLFNMSVQDENNCFTNFIKKSLDLYNIESGFLGFDSSCELPTEVRENPEFILKIRLVNNLAMTLLTTSIQIQILEQSDSKIHGINPLPDFKVRETHWAPPLLDVEWKLAQRLFPTLKILTKSIPIDMTFEKLIESALPLEFGDRTNTIRSYVDLNTIHFSNIPPLIEKIRQLNSEANLSIANIEGEYSKIPAIYAKTFFLALTALQNEKAKIFIEFSIIETIKDLAKDGHIEEEFVNEFYRTVRIARTESQYIEFVKKQQDVYDATQLARYYKNNPNNDFDYDYNQMTYWLSQAKEYLRDKPLGTRVDIREFFSNCTGVYSVNGLNHEEISDVLAHCEHLQELDVHPPVYTLEIAKALGSFLEKALYIKRVKITRLPWSGKSLHSDTIEPIANSLIYNTSITTLDFNGQHFGYEGILKILSGIDLNPNSQINSINFIECGITDEGANVLIEFLERHPHISCLTLYNFISTPLQEKLNAFYKKHEVKKIRTLYQKF